MSEWASQDAEVSKQLGEEEKVRLLPTRILTLTLDLALGLAPIKIPSQRCLRLMQRKMQIREREYNQQLSEWASKMGPEVTKPQLATEEPQSQISQVTQLAKTGILVLTLALPKGHPGGQGRCILVCGIRDGYHGICVGLCALLSRPTWD